MISTCFALTVSKVANASEGPLLATSNRPQQGRLVKSEDATSQMGAFETMARVTNPKAALRFTPVKTHKDFETPVLFPNLVSAEAHKSGTTSTTLPKAGTQAVEAGSKGPKLSI